MDHRVLSSHTGIYDFRNFQGLYPWIPIGREGDGREGERVRGEGQRGVARHKGEKGKEL